MPAGANKHDYAVVAFIINFIGQQEITADMAFAMAFPFAFERMVKPFRSERPLVGYQHKHDFFEPVHIETTGAR